MTFQERKSHWKKSPSVHAGTEATKRRELEQQLYGKFPQVHNDKRESEEAGT